MPPPAAPQKPAPAPKEGPATAKKDKIGNPNPMLAIVGGALLLIGLGYMAFKIITAPPEKETTKKGMRKH